MRNLSVHFTHDELADPVTEVVRLASGFLGKLEELRCEYGHAMSVTDGCRSRGYNDWLVRRGFKASPNSLHLISNPKYATGGCCAVDIARPGGVYLAKLVRLALSSSWALGIGPTFVHLDRRVDHTDLPAVLFTYQ